MKKITLFCLLILTCISCQREDINETLIEDDKEIDAEYIGGVQYKKVLYTELSTENICTAIENLEEYSILYLETNIDVIDCDILIEKNNIIIDGNGHRLNYNKTFDALGSIGNPYFFRISNAKNVKIQNIVFSNDNVGYLWRNNSLPETVVTGVKQPQWGRIQIINSEFCSVSNVAFTEVNGGRNGAFITLDYNLHDILVYQSKHCKVFDSKFGADSPLVTTGGISETAGERIGIIDSEFTEILNNYLRGSWSGVMTWNSNKISIQNNSNIIRGNTIFDCTTAHITVNDFNTKVENNIIYNSTDENGRKNVGVRFGHAPDNVPGYGIKRHDASGIIRNNTIYGLNKNFITGEEYNPIAITIDSSPPSNEDVNHVIIEDNNIYDCTVGVNVSNTFDQYVKVNGNSISALHIGVNTYSYANMTINNNTINSEGEFGIRLLNVSSAIVKNNTVTMLKNFTNNKAIVVRYINLTKGNGKEAVIELGYNSLYLNSSSIAGVLITKDSQILSPFLKTVNIIGNVIEKGKIGINIKNTDYGFNITLATNICSQQSNFNLFTDKTSSDIYVLNNVFVKVLDNSTPSVLLQNNDHWIRFLNNSFIKQGAFYGYAVSKDGNLVNQGNELSNYTNFSN